MSIKHTRVTSTDDSDAVVLTASAGSVVEILHVHVAYTSTATVGNRQIRFRVQDDTDVLVHDHHAGTTQAASLTRDYTFNRGTFRETAFADSALHVPIPIGTVLLPGWDLRILDSAAIDAAADDMIVNIVYKEFNNYSNGDPSKSATGLVS
jgi:hypothetical protein